MPDSRNVVVDQTRIDAEEAIDRFDRLFNMMDHMSYVDMQWLSLKDRRDFVAFLDKLHQIRKRAKRRAETHLEKLTNGVPA